MAFVRETQFEDKCKCGTKFTYLVIYPSGNRLPRIFCAEVCPKCGMDLRSFVKKNKVV
jgi:hypothetical protein